MEHTVTATNEKLKRSLLFWGMILFLLGLILAFPIIPYTNKRMGVATHLEGILNGIFIVVVALVWDYVNVSIRAKKVAYVSLLIGSYFNCFGVFMAALWGAGAAMAPVAGAGYQGAPWQETFISVILPLSALAEILCLGIILWGLRRPA